MYCTEVYAIINIKRTDSKTGRKEKEMTLDQLGIGRTATITAVGGKGPLRLRLLDMGLIPRTEVTLTKVAPMGDPLEIRIRGYELTIRKEDCSNITVTEGGTAK